MAVYNVLGCVGSITRSVYGSEVSLMTPPARSVVAVMFFQVLPPSIDFQTPVSGLELPSTELSDTAA